jgi:hypothetical protein
MGWVGVSYDGVWGMVVAVRVSVCLAIILRSILGRTRV